MAVNLKLNQSPVSILRDEFLQDISTETYSNPRGFMAVVQSTGENQTVVYRTLNGSKDQTRTVQPGDIIGAVAGIPTALESVYAATGAGTVTTIQVGLL